MSNVTAPQEKVALGIIDVDAKGQNGGTHYWATVTYHFKVTDTREDVIKKAIEAYDIVQKNLVRG